MADTAPPLVEDTCLTTVFAAGMRRRLGDTVMPSRSPPLFTALSGGPDSTALAWLAQAYAIRHGLRHTALIVDHGIRADSTAEAVRVADRMRCRGMQVEILSVDAPAPQTGLQAWARAQRYALLLARVRQARGCLLFGHHAGDQAETVMMRLARGSGLAGLAAMRVASRRAGVMILRPLLDTPSRALSAYCHAHDLTFERDPSNLDHRFERVRVRAELAALTRDGGDMADNLARLARAAGSIDHALLAALADAGYLPSIQPSGHALLRLAVTALPVTITARLLAHLIGQIGSSASPPATTALARLAERLLEGRASTLGGVRFSRRDDGWLVTAEIGRRPLRVTVRAGERTMFGGRWEITSRVDGTIRHLGVAGSGAAGEWDGTPGWCALPPLARRAMPVLETLDGALIYPHLMTKDLCVDRAAVTTARFLPPAMYRN